VAGSVPGVVAGALIRTEFLAGEDAFYLVIALVLGPLGFWLLARRPGTGRAARSRVSPSLVALSALVGVAGGIYGIGGGSIIGPILVASGYSVRAVAPAALASTFAASVAGAATFVALGAFGTQDAFPDWRIGLALGVGGFFGAFAGASFQGRIPEDLIRRGLGLIAIAIAFRYALLVLG